MAKKILLVGGGTGGHAVPLLNVFLAIKKNHPETIFHWIGEKESIESKLSTENEIPFSHITCGKLRRYFSFKTLFLPFQITAGVIQSLTILSREKPDSIFSKGGYVSLPVAIAGWIKRIPIYLHESDSVPGLANRMVAEFATGIFTAFPEADSYFDAKKILEHGMILSPEIADIGQIPLENNPKTQLLISCGSQGSSRIFDVLLKMLLSPGEGERKIKLKEGGLAIGDKVDFGNMDIHIVLGTRNADYRSKFEQFPQVKLYDFFFDQKQYLELVHNCDIVITRSSSSIFEFEALGLHMILIPLPESGNNHQYHNARIFEKKGHECILQEDLREELPSILHKYAQFKKASFGRRPTIELDMEKVGQLLT